MSVRAQASTCDHTDDWSNSVNNTEHAKCLGLEFLGDIEIDNESYQFNLVGFWWEEETRTMWTGRDSGCSCPSPWEKHKSTDDLTPCRTLTEAMQAAYVEGADKTVNREWLVNRIRQRMDPLTDLIREHFS